MIRKIIHIDADKCNGCGACAEACHEGAIGMMDGKARLMRDDWCDGLGDCLPQCPTGAITFEEREAAAYDHASVMENKRRSAPAGGCPVSMSFSPAGRGAPLSNWPVQIKLAPLSAPYYDGADLLIAADCTAFAYARIHSDFVPGRTVLICCPKLDAIDYSEKLTAIIAGSDVRSITVLRMEVPCCGGIEMAVRRSVEASGKQIATEVVTVSIDGKILNRG